MLLLFAVLPFVLLASDDYCSAYLDHLLALHQEYGLPLPPPEAHLVRLVSHSGEVGFSGGKATKRVAPPTPALGFSLDGRTVLGNFNEPGEVDYIGPAKPDPRTFGEDVVLDDLILAIQCHARGWTALSRAAYRQWFTRNVEWQRDWLYGEDYLAWIAWEHWMFSLSYDPGTPLPLVGRYMKRVFPDTAPEEMESKRGLLISLDLALTPRNSRPGSDEALIDDLIEISGNTIGLTAADDLPANPRFRALVRRGFTAVPTLITHLHDERLTRVVDYIPIVNHIGVERNFRVRDIVLQILLELAGEQFVAADAGSPEQMAAARKWFAEAEKLGEERYVMSRVLGTKQREGFYDSLFWLLCEKYPKRVPEVYRNLIDNHPNLSWHSWQFAKAIAHGPLPAADKQRMLEYAAQQRNPNHRGAGVMFLRQFDAKQAHELLIAALDRLPSRLTRDDSRLAGVVAGSTDPHEWQALARAVRRADVRGRLELLREIGWVPAPTGYKHRLAFLAEYLTDDAEWSLLDDPEPNRQFHAGGCLRYRLEVRNLAALQLASVFKFEDDPETPAQWAELRERVRVAVAKELAK